MVYAVSKGSVRNKAKKDIKNDLTEFNLEDILIKKPPQG
jgi:hypothetical protein